MAVFDSDAAYPPEVYGLRDAVVSLVEALRGGDEEEARRAFEAARRIAFIARQR